MRFFIALEAIALLSTIHFVHSSPSNNHDLSARATSDVNKTVSIQMFEWDWDSVAAECTDFIGPAGYGSVQVSPAQEHIQGTQWWTDYQAVSYKLISKRGTRAQYQNMINTCHKAGVKVIADTIFNHMTGSNTGTTGVAGSPFTHYEYPGIYKTENFHHCGLEPNDDIVNYDNRLEVQTCQLSGLADLATDTEPVRSTLATYANDLLSLGVDGLRLDAAKNIAADDINNITSRLSSKVYITQEVIYGPNEPITPQEYVKNGEVQEFRYTTALRLAFSGANASGIAGLQDLDNQGWVQSSQANVFVANHDTERSDSSLNITSPSNTYITATIFSLAHPYGRQTVLSSYSFSSYDQGAPNNGSGACTPTGGDKGWNCQHRFTAIAGMVGFRNAVGSAPLTNWVSSTPHQIAFERGALGFVAINNEDGNWNKTFSTSLPDGQYCDVISGSGSPEKCSGITINVTNGAFDTSVFSRSAIAIHVGASGFNTTAPTKSAAVTTASTGYIGFGVVLATFLLLRSA